MKHLLIIALSFALIFQFSEASAQDLPEFTKLQPEKTKLFDRIPAKFSVVSTAFERIFNFKVNEKVTLPLGADNFLEGTVTEKVRRSEEVTSINIIASNYQGALFTISRIAQPGKPVSYTGRLVSMKHGDAFMMTMQGNELVFAKQKQSSLVAE